MTTATAEGAAGPRAGGAPVRVLVLPVGADRYAVALADVREVRGPTDVTRVPGASSLVLGVVNLRGRVVVVLDTGRLLGLGPLAAPGHAPAAIAVVVLPRGLAGLALSAQPVAADLGADLGPAELEGATRRHQAGDAVASLLDLDRLLAPQRLAP